MQEIIIATSLIQTAKDNLITKQIALTNVSFNE